MDQLPNSQTATNKPRVLVIDDDMYDSEMYSMSLESAGYDVDVATDGGYGYKLLTQNNYDVVLLDLMLPIMSGSEILEKWRENHPKGPIPKIIILTNYEQDDKARGYLAGVADSYIIKASITPSNLRSHIAQVLES